jgi:hypothetical protein
MLRRPPRDRARSPPCSRQVDVSRSIDEDEGRPQRDGYRMAVTDPRVVATIRGGAVGAIAVAYVERSGIDYQRLVIPGGVTYVLCRAA